jgi:hypothetical protein
VPEVSDNEWDEIKGEITEAARARVEYVESLIAGIGLAEALHQLHDEELVAEADRLAHGWGVLTVEHGEPETDAVAERVEEFLRFVAGRLSGQPWYRQGGTDATTIWVPPPAAEAIVGELLAVARGLGWSARASSR